MNNFSKPPTTIEEQINILRKRGMIIINEPHAKEFLEYCSYYRFCGYALHFEYLDNNGERTHRYKPDTSFEVVEQLYHFDAALRRLIFHYTTLIEVSFRTTLGNISAQFYTNAHWYMNEDCFIDKVKYNEFIQMCEKEVKNSREIFIKNYTKKYSFPQLPPIWMLTELMSFATWSKLYQNLANKALKDLIAEKYNVPYKYLSSWLQALTVLRNSCAHHARIWNRNFTQAPLLSKRKKTKMIDGQHKKIFSLLLIIYDLLSKLNRENDFCSDLTKLFEQYPKINIRNLGFPARPDIIFYENIHENN